MKKKKSDNVIEPLTVENSSIMDNYNKTNEIIKYINNQAKNNDKDSTPK